MTLLYTLFLAAFVSLSFLTLLSASIPSSSELTTIDDVLDKWADHLKGGIHPNDFEFFDRAIEQVGNVLPALASEGTVLKKVYSIVLNSFDRFSVISEIVHSKQYAVKLQSDLYGFFSVLLNDEIFTEDELFILYLKACNRIFWDGCVGNKYLNLASYRFKDENIITQIVLFLSIYFKSSDPILGLVPLMSFFLRNVAFTIENGRLISIMKSIPGMAMDCLKFIHKNKLAIGHYFIEWNLAFFQYIHKIFEIYLDDDHVKILLDLGKYVKDESVTNWVIGIFSAKNISDYIYSRPQLLASALDISIKLQELHPQRFLFCMDTLKSEASEKLSSHMGERVMKKAQIVLSIEMGKLIRRFRRNDRVPVQAAYMDWEEAIHAVGKLDFTYSKPEDRIKFEEALSESFFGLFDDYSSFAHDDKLIVLNCYISAFSQLEMITKDLHEIIIQVVERFADLLAGQFSARTEEIQLNEIGPILKEYRGEIFLDRGIAALNLLKFFKYWKLNIFAMKVFINLTNDLNWYSDEIVICNLIFQVSKFAILRGLNEPEEAEDLKKTIEYVFDDLKIISKTQKLALINLIGN